MKCVICKSGETSLGTATVTLEREGMVLVIKDVPADVCTNCGEQYLREAEAGRVLREAEAAAAAGVQVDVRAYAA